MKQEAPSSTSGGSSLNNNLEFINNSELDSLKYSFQKYKRAWC